jgi:hypothetical protein
MYEEKHKNILLHQINVEDNKTSFIEVIPSFDSSISTKNLLSIDSSGNLSWMEPPEIPEIPNFEIIENDRIKSTEIFYKDGRIGVSRPPLKNYKFDIAVPPDTLMTAFHIGDGRSGFSFGNGASQGFIPEIIGMGFDENDAGLYFLGKAGNNLKSDIPLIIIDGRDAGHGTLRNRPILGVTSGDYSSYKFLIDSDGKIGIGKIPKIYKVEVEGSVDAKDFIIEGLSVRALIDIVKEHQKEIDRLTKILDKIEQQKL